MIKGKIRILFMIWRMLTPTKNSLMSSLIVVVKCLTVTSSCCPPDPDVLTEMLSFIYTGKTPNLDKLAEGLLAAADQYQIQQLKGSCENSLSSRLNVETCLSYLVLGDMYQAENLKRMSLNFIASNRKIVFKSKDWRACLQDHPALMAEVIEALD